MNNHTPPSSVQAVFLVARRDFTTRVKTKSFLISLAVIVALIAGGAVVGSIVTGKDSTTPVGIVDGTSELGTALNQAADSLQENLELTTLDDEQTSRTQVEDGSIDFAVIAEADRTLTVVTERDLDSTMAALVDATAQQLGLARALDAQDVDPQQFGNDIAETAVTVDVLKPSDPDKSQRLALAYVAMILLFFTIYLYGLYVAMGVVEEKASRVVELLLSTIKPLELLLGKILGIGAVGLVQVVIFGAVGLIAGTATGLITITGVAGTLLALVIVWYILGFIFFATLFAALGSLVSRQEEVNSVTMPLVILAMATFFSAQIALTDPTATWIRVLTWIPPFSAMIVPLRVAAGESSPIEVIGTMGITIAAIAATAVFAARVYENSVLNTGGRQSLKSALKR